MIKLLNQKDALNFVFFMVFAGLLLIFQTPFQIIWLLGLLMSVVMPFFPIQIPFKKHTLLLACLGLLIYVLLANKINALDLWGDESSIIVIAGGKFQYVAAHALNVHVNAPPFVYWLMWAWSHVLDIIPRSYVELAARLPFMMMHIVSAIFFTTLCTRWVIHSPQRKLFLFSTIIFLTYFLNPILFGYSYEIKFYTFTVFGSVLILYLYITDQLFSLSFMPLNLLLCLTSMFHYVLMIPHIALNLFRPTRRNKTLIFMAASGVIYYLLSRSKILYPDGLSTIPAAYKFFSIALSEYFESFFAWPGQIVFFVLICITLLFSKKTDLFILIATVIYFGTNLIGQLYFKYLDFNQRHFIFITPMLIFFIFYTARLFSSRFVQWYLILIFIVFTIPWGIASTRGMQTNTLEFKDTLGYKRLFTRAQRSQKTIILSIAENFKTDRAYDFYLENFKFYKSLYPDVPTVIFMERADPCEEYSDQTKFLVFRYHDKYPCED